METAPLYGFVTRMVACEHFDISDRSIGRYLKKAMIRGDDSFLRHFKLGTIDNEVIQGPQVSLELIDDLQTQKRVPTWYVSSEWLQQNFDRRENTTIVPIADGTADSDATVVESRGVASPLDSKDEIIAILKGQVAALETDKQKLEQEKKEMREDARETRELMNRMQQLMAHMQDRLLPAKTTTGIAVDRVTPVEPIEMHVDERRTEKGISPKEQRPRQKRPSSGTKRRDPAVLRQKESPKQSPEAPSIWHRDLFDFLPFRKK